MTREPLALVRLLQLASPALPIGAYSYSQGLEWMAESGTIRDAAAMQVWIDDLLHNVMAMGEAPVLWRLLRAIDGGDLATFVGRPGDGGHQRRSGRSRTRT